MTEGPVKNRRIKRRTLRTAIITVVLIVLLALILLAVNKLMQSGSEQAIKEAEEKSLQIAGEMSDLLAPTIAQIQQQLQQLSRQEDIVSAYKAADETRLKQLSKTHLVDFESAMNLRFFLPGKYELDYESKPNLGFASIDLLKKAEKNKSSTPVEAHSPGTEDEHIVFVEPVSGSDKSLLGLIHLSMPASFYQDVISNIKLEDGYAALQQAVIGGSVELGGVGNASVKQGEPNGKVNVKGSGWHFAHWSSSGGASGMGYSKGLLIAAPLSVLAVIGILWLYLSRKKQKGDDFDYIDDEDDGVVYQGAVRAIMEGAHPGVEKLISNLPRRGQARSIDLMAGMDKTQENNILTEDTFDITAAPEPESAPEPEPPKLEIDRSLFRAYDIRGIVGHTLTNEVVEVIGRAIGSEAAARNQTAIAVGRDGRTHGPELSESLIKGIVSSGMNVVDVGMVPTPVLYFAAYHLELNSGVMLTGSHNPPDYNGMKIVLGGDTLSGNDITSLYERIATNDLNSGQGNVKSVDVKTDYIRRISDDIPAALGKSFKLVIDAGNGVAGEMAPQLYRALGHEVIEQYCEVDGNFPNHHPDPSQPENMQDLINRVKQEDADLGFAFDGDGDRLGVVDKVGNIIWPDRQLILLAEDVLQRNPGASIIYDVKCSRYLKDAIEGAGGKALMWKTGHSLIKSKMKEVDSPLAGELSGHIFFKERWYGFDDALYTGARMLEILVNNDLSPTEVFAFIPEGVSTPELRVRLDETEHVGFMEELHSRAKFSGASVVNIDGLRADYTDGWGLVRPSNTSPYLVLRFEAEDEEELGRIKEKFREELLNIKPDLDLPF